MSNGLTIGTGSSKTDNSYDAGNTAADTAADAVETPKIVFVFSSPDHATEDMLAGVRDVFSEAELVGCSTGGELTENGVTTGSVVLMAVDGDDLEIGVGVGRDISEDNAEAGRTASKNALQALGSDEYITRELQQQKDGWQELSPVNFSVFSTTLTGNGSEVMRGVKRILGEGAHVSGGLAGDDWQLNETYVYHNNAVLTDALLVIGMETDSTVSHGIRHGLRKTEHRYKVTSSEANIVKELDGRPVADIYEEHYGEKGKTAQFIMTKPLGIEAGEEEPRLRDPLIIQDDGSIVYAAEVLEDSVVYIMESPSDSLIDAARAATEQAMEEAGDPDAERVKGVILHDCVCRWHCFNDDETREREVSAVRDVVGEDTPVIGWYTYGEIALPRTLAGVHNQTLVVQLFVEDDQD